MATVAGTGSVAHLWRGRIAAQQASGESIRAWCRGNGCHEHSFYWWRAKLGLSPVRRSRRQGVRSLEFAKLVVADPVAEQVEPPAVSDVEPIRLTLAGGRELVLPATMRVEQVARLVHAIESTGAANEGTS